MVVDFRLLGPLEVLVEGRQVPITAPKQRALLIDLLIHAGRVISNDQLIDDLWGPDPPADAVGALRFHVSRLRRALEAGGAGRPIVTDPPGYRIAVDPECIDAHRFEMAVRRGTGQAANGDSAGRKALGAALSCWRDSPLDDVRYEEFAQPEIRRLGELWAGALESRLSADLEAGLASELVAELASLTAQFPFRERLRQLHMEALWRLGRAGEAISVFDETVRVIREELGGEPSADLLSCRRRIARQPPPLAAAPQLCGTVPTPLDSFVGRSDHLSEIWSLLNAHRLVTVTGSGGIGKTRLVLEAAHRLDPWPTGGAWMVELAAADNDSAVEHAVAAALDLPAQADSSALEMVLDRIGRRELILILDNCEHLLEACAGFVESVLRRCPALRVLATSRESLGVRGEKVWLLPPLDTPSAGLDLEDLGEVESVRLFVDRARLILPRFDLSGENSGAVASLCRRLDGIPLAIEMAAARSRDLSVEEMDRHLGEHFGGLVSGLRLGPVRHSTLSAAFDWSYDLLPPEGKLLFQSIGVFRGGFTEPAAIDVGSSRGLGSETTCDMLRLLVGRSLVQDLGFRYRMLEPLREYAVDRLETSGDSSDVRDVHAAHFTRKAIEAGTDWVVTSSARHLEDEFWPEIDADLDNLRAAFEWALSSGDASTALELAVSMSKHLVGSNRSAEIEQWLHAALGSHSESGRRDAEALFSLAWIQADAGSLRAAEASVGAALEITRRLGDRTGEADALMLRGNIAHFRGDLNAALEWIDRAIELGADRSGPQGSAFAIDILTGGPSERLRRRIETMRCHPHPASETAEWEGAILHAEAQLEMRDGDAARGVARFRQALDSWVSERRRTILTRQLAHALLSCGDLEGSRVVLDELRVLTGSNPLPQWRDRMLLLGALIAVREGDVLEACDAMIRALVGGKEQGDRYLLWVLLQGSIEILEALRDAEAAAVAKGACLSVGRIHSYDPAALEWRPAVGEAELRKVLGEKEFDACFTRGSIMEIPDVAEMVLEHLEIGRAQQSGSNPAGSGG